uniref:Rho-GAP domain-containing protein n=2 Tax=Schistosoma mansoni TaxID=6183 RepID=A0A3Q0KRG3_SCHMA
MTTSDDIRSRMLHRANRLVNGIKNEEAWHLIGLFQQTHPNTFLQICHHTLASFLELTHDYFDDQRWPLISRLILITNQKSSENRRGRSRAGVNVTMNTNQNKNNIHEIFQSPIGSPLFMSNYQIDKLSCSSPVVSNVKLFNNEQVKNKTKPSRKRILKQLLPSMFPVPNNSSNNNNMNNNNNNNNNGSKPSRVDLMTPTKKSDQSNSKTKLFFKQQVQPLFCKSGSNETIRQLTCPFILRLNSSKIDGNLQQMKSKWRNDYTGYCIRYCNVDSTICATLIDYITSNPKLCQTEGLFRIPGNALRIRELWLKLSHHFQNPYLRIPQPDPDVTDENLSPYPIIDHTEIYEILQSYTPHDISSLILRCLSTCTEFQRVHQVLNFDSTTVDSPIYSHHDQTTTNTNNPYSYNDGEYQQTGGLIPLEAGNLLFLATELQYKLKSTSSSSSSTTTLNNVSDNEDIDHKLSDSQYDDWMYILCQSRQLLAYRIVLQLLLPTPERYLLMSLLRLFKQIDDLSVTSKMTAECLSRCTAFAVFGAPLKIKKSHNSITITNRHHNHRRLKGDINSDNNVYTFESYTNSITKRIDTLTNLIKMAHQLEDLPAIIYNTVRSRLRTHLGNSPIPRTASRLQCKSTTEKCNIESQYCLVDDRSMILKELTNVNHVQPEQLESVIQKRAKYQNDSDELIQSHPMNEMHSLSNSNRSNHIHRTKSTSNATSKNSLQQLKSNESRNDQLNNLHKTTKITTNTNTTTNNTPIDSFHLWKRYKPGTIRQELKSSIFNNTSFINSKTDTYDERFIKMTNHCVVVPHSTPSSHYHYHHKTLIKSRSSSLLEESHIFN